MSDVHEKGPRLLNDGLSDQSPSFILSDGGTKRTKYADIVSQSSPESFAKKCDR